jgi:RimJ/RimL family protein N-acetyltransferase
VASQRVLEKIGFKKDGVILFSILREAWKESKILTKNSK